jgi:hypothetical protein
MKLHDSCSTLLLSAYIQCQVTGDLSSLIIEGEPTKEQLQDAWRNICREFFDLSEDKQVSYEVNLLAQIEELNIKIITIQQIVEVLQGYEIPQLIEILRSFGYNFPFNCDNEEQYLADLKRVLNRAKKLVIELNEKQSQLNTIQKSKEPSQEVTIKYYDKILAILSQHMKYHMDENVITVSRYAAALNLYIAHCERLNASTK